MQRHEDLAFRRPDQSRETGPKSLRLCFIEDLQTNGSANIAIVGFPDFRHTPRAALTDLVKPFRDIDARNLPLWIRFKQLLQERRNTHQDGPSPESGVRGQESGTPPLT